MVPSWLSSWPTQILALTSAKPTRRVLAFCFGSIRSRKCGLTLFWSAMPANSAKKSFYSKNLVRVRCVWSGNSTQLPIEYGSRPRPPKTETMLLEIIKYLSTIACQTVQQRAMPVCWLISRPTFSLLLPPNYIFISSFTTHDHELHFLAPAHCYSSRALHGIWPRCHLGESHLESCRQFSGVGQYHQSRQTWISLQ